MLGFPYQPSIHTANAEVGSSRQACPEAVNQTLFRLIPSLKRDGVSLYLATSLFLNMEDMLLTCREMEAGSKGNGFWPVLGNMLLCEFLFWWQLLHIYPLWSAWCLGSLYAFQPAESNRWGFALVFFLGALLLDTTYLRMYEIYNIYIYTVFNAWTMFVKSYVIYVHPQDLRWSLTRKAAHLPVFHMPCNQVTTSSSWRTAQTLLWHNNCCCWTVGNAWWTGEMVVRTCFSWKTRTQHGVYHLLLAYSTLSFIERKRHTYTGYAI